MNQLVYVRGAFLGQTKIGFQADIHGDNPFSRMFFCPLCGQEWARFIVENTHWSVYTRPCVTCGGGSLLLPFYSEHNRALPYAVLLQEVEWLVEDPECGDYWQPRFNRRQDW